MKADFDAQTFAQAWIEAWNAHDLDAILSHYADNVVLISPAAGKILGDAAGTVRGKIALRDYFRRGLELYPNLRFELLDVMSGVASVVVCFTNQKGTRTAEFMEFDENGKIVRVVANYST